MSTKYKINDRVFVLRWEDPEDASNFVPSMWGNIEDVYELDNGEVLYLVFGGIQDSEIDWRETTSEGLVRMYTRYDAES